MTAVPRFIRVIGLLLSCYGFLFVASRGIAQLPQPQHPTALETLPTELLPVFLVCFAMFFLPLLYAIPRLIAGRPLRISPRPLLLTLGATFCCAIWIEVAVDSAFVALWGQKCWEYRIWPAHDGYTSRSAPVLWSLYGFFLHALHQAIFLNPRLAWLRSDMARGMLLAVDAMFLEVAANLFTLLGFGTYYFYYLPPDLAHLTTGAIFVPYALAGVLGMKILGWLERVKAGYLAAAGFYLVGLVSLWWMK